MQTHYAQVRVHNLQAQQIRRDDAASHHAQCTKATEEVQRPAHVLQEKADCQQIEEDAEGAPDAVVALAPHTIQVCDGNLADRSAVPTGQRRNEPVHLSVKRDVLDHFAAIRLEGRAEVVNIDAREPGQEPVGASGGNAPGQQVVNALLAPARDHVVSLRELFQEVWDFVRVVLQVAVHSQDELARGIVETGRQGRGLAEVPAQLDYQNPAVYRGNLFQQLAGAVAGAIVHQHQLERVAHLLHHLLQACV